LIGSNNNEIQISTREVENAFTSAKYANEIYPGTVSSVVYYFDSLYNTHTTTYLNEEARLTLTTIKMGLRIGAGISNCSEFVSSDAHWLENTSLTWFLSYFDFVVCKETADLHEYNFDPSVAVKEMGERFMRYSDKLRQARPSVSIMLGGLL